ncbi:hypothetical protein ECTT12B_3394, partial [Escherichia coli TT12B]
LSVTVAMAVTGHL